MNPLIDESMLVFFLFQITTQNLIVASFFKFELGSDYDKN